ncbi:MAG: 16S rRNA (uracil(1498)-N(3))-methyltransferase [Actinobacteria bacterium]|nr:16S rRNA (uracil(1498)-N(3))-methyltransferase [Actinomycetota bacterium]MBW3641901.1 16S rRNA (uracil(1498)-N(3))-methyltransferase [Actinomycetota bacterium]
MSAGAGSASDLPDADAHVFVADLEAPRFDDGDRHHLMQVLRLRPGQMVDAADGGGRIRRCRLGRHGDLEPCDPVVEVPTPEPALTVAVALTKGARPEVAVQKLTELGVDRIVPFVAARSVVRWEGERAVHHHRRLLRVAREAAMQSRRAHLPRVEEIGDFLTASSLPGAALCERGGRPPSLSDRAVLVGPEGGWAAAELAAGLPTVGLGPQVLRAETAAIAVATLLVGLRAGTVAPADDAGGGAATTGGARSIAPRGGGA